MSHFSVEAKQLTYFFGSEDLNKLTSRQTVAHSANDVLIGRNSRQLLYDLRTYGLIYFANVKLYLKKRVSYKSRSSRPLCYQFLFNVQTDKSGSLVMFKVIGLLFVFGAASATEASEYQSVQEAKKPIIPILKQTFQQDHEGYQFSYETGNGIHAQESGYIRNKGDEKKEVLVQQGTFTYHDEHGHPITLSYVADEHGFQPQGAHLPTPPSIPEGIQKEYHQQQQEEVQEYEEVEEEHQYQ